MLDPLSPPSHERLDVRVPEKDLAPGIHLNREQSLRSIYLQNQTYTQDSFDALHAVSGAWGGREVNQPSAAPTVASLCQRAGTRSEACYASGLPSSTDSVPLAVDSPTTGIAQDLDMGRGSGSKVITAKKCALEAGFLRDEENLQRWIMNSGKAPFQEPPPDSLFPALRKSLEHSNSVFSEDCGGTLPAWDEQNGSLIPQSIADTVNFAWHFLTSCRTEPKRH